MKLSLIIPCYNEEESIALLYKEICLVIEELVQFDVEILFVDDGSKDGTLACIQEISHQNNHVKYISFSRNFGKEAAIFAGFSFAQGDYIGLMDADLQHPPKAIIPMMSALEKEGYDIAAAKRVNRKGEKRGYSWCAKSFYKLIHHTFQIDIEDGAQDFRVMKRKVVDAILNMPEYHRFSKGVFSWVGFRTKWFEHENIERVNGTTKWSFTKSCGYAIDGIVSFSSMPLRISLCMGTVISIMGFSYVFYMVLRTLIYGSDIPGFPTLISVVLLMSGFILLSLGIMGEYIAKIFTEIKRRPIYIINETNVVIGEFKSQ